MSLKPTFLEALHDDGGLDFLPSVVRFRENDKLKGVCFYPEDETLRASLLSAEQSGALARSVEAILKQRPTDLNFSVLRSGEGLTILRGMDSQGDHLDIVVGETFVRRSYDFTL